MNGHDQLIEGHQGGFMFALRAGNHETVFSSRVYWSRQAALDAVAAMRVCSQDPGNYVRHETGSGGYFFELLDAAGCSLGRSTGCLTRAGLAAGIASVRRNGPSPVFRGLVRRALVTG